MAARFPAPEGGEGRDVIRRILSTLVLATLFWFGPPLERFAGHDAPSAAWAKNGGSGSGSGGSNSGSGSGNSGSGSSNSGSGHDDDDHDDDDDDDDDHSGPGGGGGAGGAGAAGSARVGGGPASLGANAVRLLGGNGIHVQYIDGRTERIRAGIFEALDPRGNVTSRHRATGQEERRLRSIETALAERGRASGVVLVAEIDESRDRAEITDFRGWRESVSRGRYTLSDPDGRTVTRRGLTAADIDRLRRFLYLD